MIEKERTHALELGNDLLFSLFTLGKLLLYPVLEVLDLIPNALLDFTLYSATSQTLGNLFALLLGSFEVEALFSLLLGWLDVLGGRFGLVGKGDGVVGEDVSGDENGIGGELSEVGRGDQQGGKGSERSNGSLGVLGHFILGGQFRGLDVDINVYVGGRCVVLRDVRLA